MEMQSYRETGAFDPEYSRKKPASAISADLKSYLGEYRFGIFEYAYEYIFSNGHLCDIHENEPWVLKTKRAIEKQRALGKNPSREIAEHEGINRLNFFLRSAHGGDVLVWVSPPGSRKDGYGNYGYVFKGIVDIDNGDEKHIAMSALRVSTRDIASYNSILADIMGTDIRYNQAEDFLRNPLVLSSFHTEPEKAIEKYSGRQLRTDKEFDFAMNILNPMINRFIKSVHSDLPRHELRKIFYAIEKLALHIKEHTLATDIYSLVEQMIHNPAALINEYGSTRAPAVFGSCGNTEEKSANILDGDNFIKKLLKDEDDEDEFGPLTFDCGECGGKHTRPRHIILTKCPTLDKEMAKC